MADVDESQDPDDSQDPNDIQDADDETQLIEFKPSFVLIAIDTHESMFIEDENGDTPFSVAISACYDVADSLILEQNKRKWCQFAVVLADEDDKASFLDFESSILDSIKVLKEKMNLSKDDMKKLYMRKGVFDLASFFLFCKKKFTTISSNYYQRTVIFITNNPDPVSGDSKKRFTAINEAKNFQSNDINFQLITMIHNFDYGRFYNELFSVSGAPPVDEIAEDREGLLEKLLSIIVFRYSSRKINFYPIKTDRTKYLPIVMKDFIKSQKLYNNTTVDKKSWKLVKISTREAGNPSNCFSLKHHKEIVFDLEETIAIKNSDLPIGLTLIYVSKRITDVGIVFKKSSIIEFNEKTKENADECKNLFDQFWQYCYEKDRVLVCARKQKHLDKIRFVELIPKFAFGRMLFLMKSIPYQNEIKPVPMVEEGNDEYSEKQRKVAEALVDKLTFDYDPSMFADPAYAKKRAYVKSKLLNEPMEDAMDATIDTQVMDETIEEVAMQFKELFGLYAEANSNKRKRAGAGSRANKRK